MLNCNWNGFYSVSDNLDYIKYIIKKHKTSTATSPMHVYINWIDNIVVFKIKDGYTLELQMPETMKLFSSTKKLTNKSENWDIVLSLEVVEVLLVPSNLVHNQYQPNSEILYTFMPSNSYAYLLNVAPISLVFLQTYNTEFNKIIITFTDQNSRPLEVEDKVNLTVFINK